MANKDLAYWRQNAEEDYMGTPISVLRYISELEKRTTLPSDDEIADKAYAWCQIPGDDGYINAGDDYDSHEMPAFIAGVKWVVSLIKQQDNEK
jgi:hypothetical protein